MRNKIEINCEHCGKLVLKEPRRINETKKRGNKISCSKECAYQHHQKRIKKECPICQQIFETLESSTKTYCSKICANHPSVFRNYEAVSIKVKKAWRNGRFKNSVILNGEKIRKYKTCSVCNNKFYGSKKYCSLLCLKNSDKSHKISDTRKQMFRDGKLQVTGGNTKWVQYKNFKVQGSYEYRACIILEKLKIMKRILDWNYTNKRIQYNGEDGKSHSYLLDFEIITNNNRKIYLETKGYTKPLDLLKWKAAKEQGLVLIKWFQKNLDLVENKLSLVS
jgi:hypothetical protein